MLYVLLLSFAHCIVGYDNDSAELFNYVPLSVYNNSNNYGIQIITNNGQYDLLPKGSSGFSGIHILMSFAMAQIKRFNCKDMNEEITTNIICRTY